MYKKLSRILITIVAVFVILLSLVGILGAWGLSHAISNATLTVFSAVQTGVEVVDTAVGRVDTRVQTARSEVQQVSEMVTNAATNLQENKPVLTALSERLDTRLGPAVDNIQEALLPVRDVLIKVDSAVSILNSMPFISEQAPNIDKLDQTLTQLSTLSADVQQLRTTIRTAANEQTSQLTQGVATAVTDLTTRIDSRLADVQTGVQSVQSEISALQTRIEALQSRLLLIYNLFALIISLLFIWVIYSQIVVIRYHWKRSSNASSNQAVVEANVPATIEQIETQSPDKLDKADLAAEAKQVKQVDSSDSDS
jgi:peptidoglycan hydrolase CwlO-like protein